MKECVRGPIYDIVNIIRKISLNIIGTSCIYTCVQICVLCIYLGSADLLNPITGDSWRDQQNEHNRAIRDINHSEYARPIAWSVVSKCTYRQISDSNFCHVLIAENNFLLTVPTPLSTMNISHSLTIPEASINGILINTITRTPAVLLSSLLFQTYSFTCVYSL